MCIVERKKTTDAHLKEKKKIHSGINFKEEKKKEFTVIASHHQHTLFIYLLIINFEKTNGSLTINFADVIMKAALYSSSGILRPSE